MIRIKKTKQAPAALATPAIAAARLALETRYDANPAACRVPGSRLLNVPAALYNDEKVKTKLIAQQREKCCYCEAKFLHVGYGDVEHYRPKNGFRQDAASPLEKPGYYWLAYTWDNLLFSCKRCNGGYKRNYFPLANPAGRARSHHDQPQLGQEQPLLLHPAHDNPAAHIRFRRAVAVSKTPRGRATIALCGLNRKHNLERRRTHLAHLDSHDSLASLDPLTMSPADLARQIAKCGSVAVFIKRIGQAKTICETAALDAAEFAGMARANFRTCPPSSFSAATFGGPFSCYSNHFMQPTATAAPVEKDNKRITTGWTFYDWANSVYPLVITSSLFPIYWGSQAVDAQGRDIVTFLGYTLPGSSLVLYALSAAYLLIAILSPFLTSLADYSGRKKLFLQIFCYLGAASCAGLYFFTKDTLTLSTFIFIGATVGFSGSIVFYNSYLPEISSEEKFDSLSARGFSMGYIGSVLLLVICLGIIMGPHIAGGPEGVALFGMSTGQATRLSFLLTGLWWIGFAQIPFFTLPADTGRPADAPVSKDGWLLNGFRELGKVWDQLKQLPNLKRFLLAYFTYNMGVQTVMYVATIFGDKVLKLDSTSLIVTILLLQIVGILGAWLFAKLSDRIGNTRALSWAVFIWMLICVAGYFVQAGWSFFALAAVIGLTMGAVQSLSRSTYSKIIPENTPNNAAFFSFFDVVEKLGIVIGTLSFGLIGQITGSMRNSILSLIVFFIFGLGFLLSLRGKKLRDEPASGSIMPPAPASATTSTPEARR